MEALLPISQTICVKISKFANTFEALFAFFMQKGAPFLKRPAKVGAGAMSENSRRLPNRCGRFETQGYFANSCELHDLF